MIRLALVAAVFTLAACATKEQPADTAATDTSAPAMAPAPSDTGMMDSTKGDTTKRDTTTKKVP